MAPARPIPWGSLFAAMAAGVVLAGVMGWWANLQDLERRITQKRSALKKLTLSGGIPPTQDVMSYLTSRQASLEERYRRWLERATAPVAEAATADAQLYFQEQLHEVQRTLERLSAARGAVVPEQLGFPKELPPSDTVPRLLVQLSLIKEAAALLYEQGVTILASFKIEDPELVPEQESGGTFLMRLPVRVRLHCSSAGLVKVLGAIERAQPLIDVRAIRIAGVAETEPLEVELAIARYLVMAAMQEVGAEERARPSAPANTASSGSRAPRKKRPPASEAQE